MIGNNSSILIVEVGGIGDVVMSIPAIRNLRQNYPYSYIAVLIARRAKPLLRNCPYINDVFTLEIENFTFSRYALNLYDTAKSLKTIISLRRKGFELAINFHRIASFWGSLRMRLLFKTIRPKKGVGRDTDRRGTFYDIKLEENIDDSEHEVTRKLRLINMLGVPTDNQGLELWVDSEDNDYVDKLFSQLGITNNDLVIGINPNSAQAPKLWEGKKFARLSDALSDKYKAKICFLGSMKNKKRIKGILSLAKNRYIDLSGKLTLNQYIALVQKIKAFITLDSGPMHIASVFKVPTIALFGPGNPSKFGPYHNEKALILKKKKMSAIGVNEVMDLFDSLVNKYNII
ncbi:MAG: hypothetical protein B1H08_01715 [Candidatus Omnitrophica bacterium 4484_171]|nr:MAG: hypothetical protein B1H08_01715 [Candidatus Omnitrophica bacterium 4484_171]